MKNVLIMHAMAEEAMHSVAMEHPSSCGCLTCRAADGDPDARAKFFAEMMGRHGGFYDRCGEPRKSDGKPCRRVVDGPDETCWQHS